VHPEKVCLNGQFPPRKADDKELPRSRRLQPSPWIDYRKSEFTYSPSETAIELMHVHSNILHLFEDWGGNRRVNSGQSPEITVSIRQARFSRQCLEGNPDCDQRHLFKIRGSDRLVQIYALLEQSAGCWFRAGSNRTKDIEKLPRRRHEVRAGRRDKTLVETTLIKAHLGLLPDCPAGLRMVWRS